jgi:hypothetical protein
MLLTTAVAAVLLSRIFIFHWMPFPLTITVAIVF